MEQPFRLKTGGRIDRTRPLRFVFDGKGYTGYPGDTLASALIANGVHLVGRSFKYHRPRGILSAGAEEPNALVQLGLEPRLVPNARATQVDLIHGLEADPVNCWPNVRRDVLAGLGLAAPLMPAGFYYKTFLSSRHLWRHVFEPLIRRAAGWGRMPEDPDPDVYTHQHLHRDVVVVGAGPAGLAATLAAARAGARVALIDEGSEPGGSLLGQTRALDGRPADHWVAEVVEELCQLPEVLLLTRTTAAGLYDDGTTVVAEQRLTDHVTSHGGHGPRARLWWFTAKTVILATGAHERPIVFPQNDRPGIMLASAARTYALRYGAVPGQRMVLFTTNSAAYETAIDLQSRGVRIEAIVDARPDPTGPHVDMAEALGIRIHKGCAVIATDGRHRLDCLEVMQLSPDLRSVQSPRRVIDCDLLCVSGGWSPVAHLYRHAGGQLAWNAAVRGFTPVPGSGLPRVVGSAAGTHALSQTLELALKAGAEAAQEAGFGDGGPPPTPIVTEADALDGMDLWRVPDQPGKGGLPIGRPGHLSFVDLQNDTTAADIDLAHREGLTSVEHMKRYTLTGFGTDQGKTSQLNGAVILARADGKGPEAARLTAQRPPYTPLTFGTLAGRRVGGLLDTVRETALQDIHRDQGAAFEPVGQWLRPRYYPQAGESMDKAVARECRAARQDAGLLDASTLGKIDAQGPDVVEFLERIYATPIASLAIGKVRYGLICKDDGMLADDGAIARLGETHFHLTTTTGNAAWTLNWMEEWLQTEWPDLRVRLTSVTEQWAVLALTGPKAREILAPLAPEMDLTAEAFPFMTWREGAVAGIPARLFRVSFTGELSFEINVPWSSGPALWQTLMDQGAPLGLTPYGTEAMHVLRAEKGFILVGQETDGSVTPLDLGMAGMLKKKRDFIGKRGMARSDLQRADRKVLVGLRTDDPAQVLPEGSPIVEALSSARPLPMLGHVTSSYASPMVGRAIALALVKGGRDRMGQALQVPLADGDVAKVQVVEPIFWDPEGQRRDG
ncbi:sarcosine oxidase subunit alpha family protein [Rhodospirillum sp. A1_3_36]|uniref:sarcosine oxidase subunit alpha family protein n=1 Tax=Rhodospirillum sp. A1_3_36 TaxID=3391666 RepID=UPI0039A4932A